MASIASNGNNNISTENTPNELTPAERKLQDKVAALTEQIKRKDQELQDLKLKIGKTPISTTNTKSIHKIIRAILVPKKTHENYKYAVDQICEFLKTTVKTKSKNYCDYYKSNRHLVRYHLCCRPQRPKKCVF